MKTMNYIDSEGLLDVFLLLKQQQNGAICAQVFKKFWLRHNFHLFSYVWGMNIITHIVWMKKCDLFCSPQVPMTNFVCLCAYSFLSSLNLHQINNHLLLLETFSVLIYDVHKFKENEKKILKLYSTKFILH